MVRGDQDGVGKDRGRGVRAYVRAYVTVPRERKIGRELDLGRHANFERPFTRRTRLRLA